MSNMMHRNCRLGCCLAGSRRVDRKQTRREIEMEFTAKQTEERYLSDLEDTEDHHHEYWQGVDYHTQTTPAEDRLFEEMLVELMQKPLDPDAPNTSCFR